MLNFINKACFGHTKQHIKLFLMLFLDNWIEKIASALGVIAFFILFTKNFVPTKIFYTILICFFIQFFIALISKRYTYILNFDTVSNSLKDFQIVLGDKLRKLPMGIFQQKSSAEILKVIVNDHNTVNMTWTGVILTVASILVNVLLMIILLPMINPYLALVLISLIPLSCIFFIFAIKKYKKTSQQLQEAYVESSKTLMDYVNGLSTLRLFNMKSLHFTRLTAELKGLKDKALKKELSAFPIGTFASSLLFMGTGIVSYSGIMMLEKNLITPFVLLIFILVSAQIFAPLITLYLYGLQLFDFKMAVGRIYDFYNYQEISEGNESVSAETNIQAKNLDFSYGYKDVLQNTSLDIKPKKIYALVGPSGCGKTTLLKLILRYFEPQSGRLTLNSKPISSYDLESYLSKFAMVFQDAFMFNQSIAYNIGIGMDGATMTQIQQAAKLANCHHFIAELKDGYNTLMGVKGGNLSAGQRQRISIARAFLKDADIILMDEPTASLDVENELLIKEALKRLSKEKTVILISHRLNFIKDVDKIIVMDKGHITQIGSHQQLMTTSPIYQNLWAEEEQVLHWQI